MNAHVFDELPLLLTGEADRATVTAVTVHLRECDDCRDELIAALAGHAALMSAAKYAPDLIAAVESESHVATGSSESSAPVMPSAPAGPPVPPDLSNVFAQVRAEAANGRSDRPAPKHGRGSARPRRVWLAAAAAVVVLGAGGGLYAAESGGSSTPSRSVALSAFDQGTTAASVKLIGDNKMNLDASSLPALASGSYYEVWLTNAARTAMAPVGVLGADRKATITVPASEMAGYAAVEVSVQMTASVGNYSGHSVLRGTYA